jgi:hypothetical protein
VVDSENANKEFNVKLEERVHLKAKEKDDKDHQKLALFKLESWTLMTDKELANELVKLKEELSEHKYYVQDYIDIITRLSMINDLEYGLFVPGDEQKVQNKSDDWTVVNIQDYVEKMSLSDKKGDELTEEMLKWRSSTTDGYINYSDYEKYVLPLMNMVYAHKEEKKLIQNPFNCGADEFAKIVNDNLDYYKYNGFLVMYDESEVEKVLMEDDVKRIVELRNAIQKIFIDDEQQRSSRMNYLNTNIIYDYQPLVKLRDMLHCDRHNNRVKYNSAHARNREIALCGLEQDIGLAIDFLNEINEALEDYARKHHEGHIAVKPEW